MGMESYNIMLLANSVSIVKNHEYCEIRCHSNLPKFKIKKLLVELCDCGINENEYIYREIVDVKVYFENNYFQGIEMRGCLSCVQEGIERCYELYNYIKMIIPLNFYVLNQMVDIKNEGQLYDTICNYYSEKINLFQKQYGDEELIASTRTFYKILKKRKRWYYKIIHSILHLR